MKKVLGITAEYDPFHKGHAYQIARARELADPEAVVCVMSGSFTQRGEPAVLGKWERAKLATEHGADLVFELPFTYACSRAGRFARGAVDLLASAGVTHISFGCEAERPEDLEELARLQRKAGAQIEERVQAYMKEGCSRVKGLELASGELFGRELTQLSLQPNNILALEYLKRIFDWEETRGVKIVPVPVRRAGSGYREADPASGFAGGTALRQMIAAGEDVTDYLPYDSRDIRWTDLPAARKRLYGLVRAMILRARPEQLATTYCVGEGMEHRLAREALRCESYEEFLSSMVSKRYTAGAIRRIMIYILMNVGELPECRPYGMVLAAGAQGRMLLREGCPGLEVIANPNRTEDLPQDVLGSLLLDRRASDLFHLATGLPLEKNNDRRQHPRMG